MPTHRMPSETIGDVMTKDPVMPPSTAAVADAARQMKSRDVGAVIVTRDSAICGIVTDRDVVVRAVAEDTDPAGTELADVCSAEIVTVSPQERVDQS